MGKKQNGGPMLFVKNGGKLSAPSDRPGGPLISYYAKKGGKIPQANFTNYSGTQMYGTGGNFDYNLPSMKYSQTPSGRAYKNGGTIHINPANKGKFNATKARTGKSTEELTHSSNPVTKKRAVFAQNAAKWKHANGGPLLVGNQHVAMGGSLKQMYDEGGALNVAYRNGGKINPYALNIVGKGLKKYLLGGPTDETDGVISGNQTPFSSWSTSKVGMDAMDPRTGTYKMPNAKSISQNEYVKPIDVNALQAPDEFKNKELAANSYSSAIQAGTSFIGNFAETNRRKQEGAHDTGSMDDIKGAAKGMGTGAAIGSTFGPIGTAVGAAVGGVAGYIGGRASGKAKKKAYDAWQADYMKAEQSLINSNAASRYQDFKPTSSGYYANGGSLLKRYDLGGPTELGQNKGSKFGNFKRESVQEKANRLRRSGYKGSDSEVVRQKEVRDSVYNVVNSVDSRRSDAVRGIVPLPQNASQAIAKLTGNSTMSNSSLKDAEKSALYHTMLAAKKRTGQPNGGTLYEDYANGTNTRQDYDNWFNKGKNSVGTILSKSGTDPYYTMASTVGQGKYWSDPETGGMMYTDVYDWNKSKEKDFSGKNLYQNVRNLVRSTEDKNLTKEKNDKNRMAFRFDPKEISDIDEKLKGQQRDPKAKLIESMMAVKGNLVPTGYAKGGKMYKYKPSSTSSTMPKFNNLTTTEYNEPNMSPIYTDPLLRIARDTAFDQYPQGKGYNVASTFNNWYENKNLSNSANLALEGIKLGTGPVWDAVGNTAQELISQYGTTPPSYGMPGNASQGPKVVRQQKPLVRNAPNQSGISSTYAVKPLMQKGMGGNAYYTGMSDNPFGNEVSINDYWKNKGMRVPMMANGGSMASNYMANQKAVGGNLVPLSSDAVEVKGPSHANGGVKLPEMEAEVEGKEVIKDDYVFSEQLGFAKEAKKLAKAKGRIEEKPSTPERINSLKLLESKENQLKLAQEFIRKQNNLQ